MSENLSHLKLAEKLESHLNNLGLHQYCVENNISESHQGEATSKVFRKSDDSRILKSDILPILNNQKAYKIFEFLSRNVQSKEVTQTLRSQLKAFEEKSGENSEILKGQKSKSYYTLLTKTSEKLSEIKRKRDANKALREKIARLKQLKKQNIEKEKAIQETKDTEKRIVREAHLNRSRRMLGNFTKLQEKFTQAVADLADQPPVGRIKETSIEKLATNLEKVAQENRWKYMQQLKNSKDAQKKNMVKQILPDLGEEVITKSLQNLEHARVMDPSLKFSSQLLLNTVNGIIQKMFDQFKQEFTSLCNFQQSNPEECDSVSESENLMKKYKQKVSNLKALFEVELQRQFTKSKICCSNSSKFERELQKQLAMKLSRQQKLSLAVYQERFVQEYIKEKYQILKANNETLQQALMGHDCFQSQELLEDYNEKSLVNISKEISISCSFLPRLKARTENFVPKLVNISTEVQANLIEISNFVAEELNLLKYVNYSSQNVQEEINKQVYSLDRFVLNPYSLRKNKISLSNQDPLFVIMKIFEKMTRRSFKSGIDFVITLYEFLKKSMLSESTQKIKANIDYTEKLDELYNLIQGYDTKFVKSVSQKLDFVSTKLDSFDLSQQVQSSLEKLLNNDLHKLIPFIKDSTGRNAEFYYYKFDSLRKQESGW
ncbi:unnamed protein product [Moneuplotes crassus]|uniref:Uncharacterized protein n=1 Tax=Euplotes crassus TaxID=5936 RepID=A0AAD1U4F1_EUPCR|nr:unnamed protein product [Moneuplotes crassus]